MEILNLYLFFVLFLAILLWNIYILFKYQIDRRGHVIRLSDDVDSEGLLDSNSHQNVNQCESPPQYDTLADPPKYDELFGSCNDFSTNHL
ncbi:unnamed protein product [Chironomus riparius]|uniref:Uncharacterized protein n=1 Tax=Chironomus riparius TaxID=315576 RepID=A0A9N9WS00_9DIPT|nr:unnamed protein product [Chironomus riparius]